MQLTYQALTNILKPAKVHFGLYAEEVKHIHLHVFPRMPHMPAGNIPVTVLSIWYDLLNRVGLKQPYNDDKVAQVAAQLQIEFQRLTQIGSK